MKPKFIYIAGLGHSGSTILDMALGAHPKITGLGEIYPYLISDIKERKEQLARSTCSCMVRGDKCRFWSETLNITKHTGGKADAYISLHKLFKEKFGKDTALLDSSKNSYPFLKKINTHFDLKIILLTRDYRSWIHSRNSRLKKPILYLALKWFLVNKKINYQLNKMQLPYLRVGYEEPALYPESILKKISEYIGEEYTPDMLPPANTSSHIIHGNVSRADPAKRKSIVYDMRRMTSLKLMFWQILIFPLQIFNKKWVYSNFYASSLKSSAMNIFFNKRNEEVNKKVN